jgi:hypothetical protein
MLLVTDEPGRLAQGASAYARQQPQQVHFWLITPFN